MTAGRMVPLTQTLARYAAESLVDVYTPTGDAVTIASLADNGYEALVNGRHHHEVWFHIDALTIWHAHTESESS